MQTHLTSGAFYGRTRRLYVWGLSRSKHKWRNRLALRVPQPPITPAQACPAVGRSLRGHGAPLAAGGQKYRRSPWLTLGCRVICPLGRVDAGKKPQCTRDGSVRGGECRGTGVHGPPGRPQPPDSRSFQHRPGLCGLGQGRGRRGQWGDASWGAGLPSMNRRGRGISAKIVRWSTASVVAKGKISHAGVTQGGAILSNTAGKKVEFGLP